MLAQNNGSRHRLLSDLDLEMGQGFGPQVISMSKADPVPMDKKERSRSEPNVSRTIPQPDCVLPESMYKDVHKDVRSKKVTRGLPEKTLILAKSSFYFDARFLSEKTDYLNNFALFARKKTGQLINSFFFDARFARKKLIT